MNTARAEIYKRLGGHRLPKAKRRAQKLRPTYSFMRSASKTQEEDLYRIFITRAQRAGADILQAQSIYEAPLLLQEWDQGSSKKLNSIYTAALETQTSADASNGVEGQMKSAADAHLIKELPWRAAGYTLCAYKRGVAIPRAIGSAFAGLAESGSLVVGVSPVSPTGLYFLADNLCVLLQRKRILPMAEDLLQEGLPAAATIHFITGPSRTADIEQTTEIGAHGPRELVIILYDNNDKSI